MSVDVSSPSLSDAIHAMRPRPRNFQGTPTPPHTPHLGDLPTLLNVYAWLAHEHDVAQGRARHFAKLGPETAAESTRRARHCARAMSGVHDQIQQIIAAGAAKEA